MTLRVAPARLLLLAALLPLEARAGLLSAGLDTSLCPEPLKLAKRIQTLAEAELAEFPDGTVFLAPAGEGRMVLRLGGGLVRAGEQVELDMPFSRSDCRELPMAVVLTIQGWLSRDWAIERSPAPPPEPPPLEPRPLALEPRPPAAPPSEPSFEIVSAVGGFAGVDRSLYGTTISLAALGWLGPRWRLGAGIRYDDARAISLATGTADAAFGAALGLGGAALRLSARSTLTLLGGLGIERLSVQTEGVAREPSATRDRLLAVGTGRWMWDVSRHLALHLELGGAVAPASSPVLLSPEASVRLPSARVSLSGGLVWRAF